MSILVVLWDLSLIPDAFFYDIDISNSMAP